MAIRATLTSSIALTVTERRKVFGSHQTFNVFYDYDRIVNHYSYDQNQSEEHRVFIINPSSIMPANLPIIDTGIATHGISVALRFFKNSNTTKRLTAWPRPKLF
jgi:hypothetical protein